MSGRPLHDLCGRALCYNITYLVMAISSTLLICTRCRAPGDDPAAPRLGAALLGAVRAAGARLEFDLDLRGVACLSGCKRHCAAAVTAPGKVSYVFGDLPADTDGVSDLLAVARAHAAAPDGHLPRAARPERLRAGILARIPPLHWVPSPGAAEIGWPA